MCLYFPFLSFLLFVEIYHLLFILSFGHIINHLSCHLFSRKVHYLLYYSIYYFEKVYFLSFLHFYWLMGHFSLLLSYLIVYLLLLFIFLGSQFMIVLISELNCCYLLFLALVIFTFIYSDCFHQWFLTSYYFLAYFLIFDHYYHLGLISPLFIMFLQNLLLLF